MNDHAKTKSQLGESSPELGQQLRIFEAFLSSISDYLYVFDSEGHYVYANKILLDLWGLSSEQVVGKSLRELGYSEDIEVQVLQDIQRVIETGEIVKNVNPYIGLAGGSGKEHILAPVFGRDGSVLFVAGATRDVTESKQVERTMRAHRQLLEAVINNMPNSVALMRGNDLRIVFVNPAYRAVTLEKEIVGKTLDELWPELNCDFTSLCRQVLETGKPFYEKDSLYMIRRSPDGPPEQAYFTWGLIPVDLPEEKCKGVLNVSQETTERVRVEKALKEREERSREVFENIGTGISIYETINNGEDFIFKDINPAAARIGRTRREDHIGKNLLDVYPKTKDLGILAQFQKAWHTGIPRRLPIFNYKDNRLDFWLDSYVCKLPTGELMVVYEDITESMHAQEDLKKAYEEIKKLNKQLKAENIYLREKVESTDVMADIIGVSNALRYVMDRIKHVAQTDATVFLTGETGTGKGLFARALHEASSRKGRPFVHVNCAGLPPNLIESELFGREKGAFTGSTAKQIGRFELATGGSIFLDEIGELPLELQAKLLKVIEDGELERLGSPHPIKVDVRIIASTNRNLEEEIKRGLFRKDLFYRLNVFPITIPPLRQRREDILLLAKSFTERFGKKHGKNITKIPLNTMKGLESYDWPGNVRELMHVIERAVIVSDGPMLSLAEKIDALPNGSLQKKRSNGINAQETKGLVEVEREHILRTLRRTGWKIEGNQGAAQLLRMKPSTMRSRMKKLDIRRPAAH